ncbi:MAG: phage tail protein [Calditrichaeota bacterium]|nr:phage tail protein [Calditrichota bacterium]
MSMFSVNPHRRDPYKNFKFKVKWDGQYIPAISWVGALNRTTETIEHRDGGEPNALRRSPGLTVFDPVVIERGLSHDTAFEDWANLVFNMSGDAGMSLQNYRKDIVIELYNMQGSIVMAWFVRRCWVSEYQPISELNANGTAIVFERIVLQHEGWERDKDINEPKEF